MGDGGWKDVNWTEVGGTIMGSIIIGFVRVLMLIRQGRKIKWVDIVLEPCLAVLGGVLMWGITEMVKTPDIMQAVFTSLGAWGGPRTIRRLEVKYFGGTRQTDRGE